MTHSVWKYQKGVSLIELMIALMLSIFIAAAMISLFVNSKQSYRVNENMSRLQENARFAVSFISRDIRMADYRACVTDAPLGNAVSGENNAGLNGSDTITIIYQTNDCGAATAIDTRVYSIQNNATGSPGLFRSRDGGAAEELVEGIENLQISYGEDTDGDNVPNYFVDAASITDWAQAVGIRFTFIARTLETNITTSGGRVTRGFSSTITLRNRVP